MSHIVEIQADIRDTAAIGVACQRLRLAAPRQGTYRLFSGEVSGIGVQLPGWRYPLVCNVNTGELRYDNYLGRWGEQRELDRFRQAYACERTKIEARRKGYSVSEQTLPDGSVRMTIDVGGQA